MIPTRSKRASRTELVLSGVMVVVGLGISAASLAQLMPEHRWMAQATQPLQSTPGAESKPAAPAEPATTGARPTEIPPQPARPEPDAQKAGAAPALPPAPAEKVAPPIPAK
ncbi:hypothetical protein [Tardiphaga sp.]|uniref:hypothetical protein n=1 Tax=Tardiphaga sp. TaxID=1926292 RepID=UPI00262B44A6|nr:hypothetical protein [Tardiphaga sp.]MDB5618955.1 hypothetical protein [Tardiphaga sp.]